MAPRLAGRVLTSPIAFLLAGIADVLLYAVGALRRRARATRAEPNGRPQPRVL